MTESEILDDLVAEANLMINKHGVNIADRQKVIERGYVDVTMTINPVLPADFRLRQTLAELTQRLGAGLAVVFTHITWQKEADGKFTFKFHIVK